jgi:phosphopantetheinyl transferase (holo-ACP synthase)
LNITMDLAASVLLGTPLPLGLLAAASVASYVASEVASFEAKKFLDKSELTDNQKMVADLAVRILAGATVSGVAHKVAGNIAAKEAEKKAAETVVKKAAEETDVAVQEVKRRTAKLPEGVNKIPLPDATEYAFQVEGHSVKLRVESRGVISSQKASSISFEVDDTFDMNPDLEQRIAKKITLKLRRTFNHIVDQMEEGEIVGCAAHRGDPKREYRVKKFESLGFAKPRGIRDVQLGKVKNGKIEPYYPEGPGFWASPGLKGLF